MAKILVIDDDPMIIEMIKDLMTDAGHQVFAAMDASGGMMLAAREKPDLITLDFHMPAGDGAQVMARIRGNNFTARTPILFVSGMSEYDLSPVIPDDPLIRFIQKPIDFERLKVLVNELLSAAGAAGSAAAAPPPPAAPPSPPPAPPPAPPSADPKPRTDEGGAFGGDILDLDV